MAVEQSSIRLVPHMQPATCMIEAKHIRLSIDDNPALAAPPMLRPSSAHPTAGMMTAMSLSEGDNAGSVKYAAGIFVALARRV